MTEAPLTGARSAVLLKQRFHMENSLLHRLVTSVTNAPVVLHSMVALMASGTCFPAREFLCWRMPRHQEASRPAPVTPPKIVLQASLLERAN
jgi:hypothetical protein